MEFYKIYRNRVIDKLQKKIEEKEFGVDEKKIELMLNIWPYNEFFDVVIDFYAS